MNPQAEANNPTILASSPNSHPTPAGVMSWDLPGFSTLSEETSEAKDRIIALLAHELRTPLTPVLIAAQSLLEDKTLPPEMQETVRMIERHVRQEASIIGKLLDSLLIHVGRFTLTTKQLDPHEAVRQAVTECAEDFSRKGQKVKLAFTRADVSVDGDLFRLKQVFTALLENAAKFGPEGSSVYVESKVNDGTCQITVSDDGPGIDPEQSDGIFQPFGQQSSPAVRGGRRGLGLSLAIAKAIVEGHGGELTARKSEQGEGSAFSVTLPARAA